MPLIQRHLQCAQAIWSTLGIDNSPMSKDKLDDRYMPSGGCCLQGAAMPPDLAINVGTVVQQHSYNGFVTVFSGRLQCIAIWTAFCIWVGAILDEQLENTSLRRAHFGAIFAPYCSKSRTVSS